MVEATDERYECTSCHASYPVAREACPNCGATERMMPPPTQPCIACGHERQWHTKGGRRDCLGDKGELAAQGLPCVPCRIGFAT